MVTIGTFVAMVAGGRDVTVKSLLETFDELPMTRVIETISMLMRHRIVEMEGAGVLAVVRSRSGTTEATLQAAIDAGVRLEDTISP